MSMKQVYRLLPEMVLWAMLLFLMVGAAPTYGEFLEYTYPPRVAHVDLDRNIVVVVLFGEKPEYVIQRLDTGERLWSIPNQDVKADFGADAVVVTRKGRIQVLDKTTGRELWSQSGEHLNEIGYAHFIGDTRWTVVRLKESIVIYTPDGQPRKPSIPDKPAAKMIVVGWMQDNKTLLLTVQEEKEDGLNVLTTYFWEPESNHIKEGYVLTSTGKPHLFGMFPDNKAIYWEYKPDYGEEQMVLVDAVTGKEHRAFDFGFNFGFTENAYLTATNEILNGFAARDMETGKIITTVSEPEHTFYLNNRVIGTDKDWVISSDAENRYWIWPIEDNSKPRLIYKPLAGNYFPGYIESIRSPYIFFNTGKSQMEAYLLDGMVRVKSWRAEGTKNRVFTKDICSNVNRVIAWDLEGGRGDEERIWTTQVFEAFNPYPLCTLSGSPRGISPDGRYCMMQQPENGPVRLVEVDSSRTCAVIESEKEGRARVIFSSDNRMAAIYFSNGGTTFISLEEPHAQRTIKGGNGLVFSPDGNFYALLGTGEAKLYDIATDALVHTFVEPEKVEQHYERPPEGFLETAGRFGRNIIGTFVPAHKESPFVNCAFSEDGKQLITMASGKLLRVWDVKSGKLVRTIRTGLAAERNEQGYIRNYVTLSRNGKYAFASNQDGFDASSLWDLSTGRRIAKEYLPRGEIRHISVADNGSAVYMAIGERLYCVAGKNK